MSCGWGEGRSFSEVMFVMRPGILGHKCQLRISALRAENSQQQKHFSE